MSWTTRAFSKVSAFALALAVVALFSAAANAASINYGNFGPVPPGVVFQQVTESSGTDPVPLYGPPAPFSVGLDFNPIAFTALSTTGVVDFTDGQLNFTAMSGPVGGSLNTLHLFERGDYGLAGFGNAGVSASATVFVTVTQINGLPVPGGPFNVPAVAAAFSDTLPGPVTGQPWSLGLTVNIGAALANAGYVGQATKVDVAVNNQLVAASQPGAGAFIAKKEFIIDFQPIPEPSSVALIGMALAASGLAGRKRR